jgi:hypothetical protein
MLSKILTGVATTVAFWIMNRYRRVSIDLIKIEAATYYIKAIQSGRQGLLAAMLVWLGIFFFALGVILLHASLFVGIYLWFQSMAAVAIGLLVLGAVYVLVILLILGQFTSEESWMKFFKADKLVNDLTKKT